MFASESDEGHQLELVAGGGGLPAFRTGADARKVRLQERRGRDYSTARLQGDAAGERDGRNLLPQVRLGSSAMPRLMVNSKLVFQLSSRVKLGRRDESARARCERGKL